MKLYNKIIAIISIGLVITACTDEFDKYNSDPLGFTEEQQSYDFNTLGIPATVVQQGIYCNYNWGWGINWPFQVMQNLTADMFSGYFHDFNPAFNDKNSAYNLDAGWYADMWVYTYGYIAPSAKKFETLAQEGEYSELEAVAKILNVMLMHRVTDMYGPIVYTTFGDGKVVDQVDSQEAAYRAFFDDLDKAIKILSANTGPEVFERFDIMMPNGKRTLSQWLKTANSLRLRLALRVSNVNPTLAKEQAQLALDPANGGVLENANETVATQSGSKFSNPLGEINKVWGEVYINANMESVLAGYEDPRISKYFEAFNLDAVHDTLKGHIRPASHSMSYRGIRQGVGFTHDKYKIASSSTITTASNAILLTAAEVWFLRAEAALRGYSSENAKACYEAGVTTSFNQWGVTGAEEYLASNKKPADYVDLLEPKYDAQAASTITPKWNDGATNEENLERIITQKWIACYPEGAEAWTEQRRTGYPKLFKNMINKSNGKIDTDVMIRRLPFPPSIQEGNKAQYDNLVLELKGNDNGGTRLWWDTGSNF